MVTGLHFLSPVFLLIFAVSVGAFTHTKYPELPSNIIQNHIKKSANFSVDPCEDFYRHVCPNTVKADIHNILYDMKIELVEKVKKHDVVLKYFTHARRSDTYDAIAKLDANILKDMCEQRGKQSNFSDVVKTEEESNDRLIGFAESSCEEKANMVMVLFRSGAQYDKPREFVIQTVNAYIASELFRNLDKKARELYKKLRNGVTQQFKKTPWAVSNGAVKMYTEALNNITFSTFVDAVPAVLKVLKGYKYNYKSCMYKLNGTYTDEIQNVICEVSATKQAHLVLSNPIENVYEDDRRLILVDHLNIFNSNDDHIYLGNEYLLLLNTDFTSDLYGGIGYLLLHEIMHTFVFDENDKSKQNPLAPFWTKNADCVSEQVFKTCNNFPTVFGPDDTPVCNKSLSATFEEDSADIAAYRIASHLYRRAYTRKTVVSNYESLTEKQLFFYGAALTFCRPYGTESIEYRETSHTNDYQRLHNMMSQMDEFADAFQCKKTDKMVLNKSRHCAIYGDKAPITRKTSSGK